MIKEEGKYIVMAVLATIFGVLTKLIGFAVIILSIANFAFMLVRDHVFMEWHSIIALAVWGIVLGISALVMAIITVVNLK